MSVLSFCLRLFLSALSLVFVVVATFSLFYKQHALFIVDHIQGRFGLQEANYHCSLNRFNHSRDYSKLVFEAAEGMSSLPPTIDASDYTPQKLKEVSDNFRLPVVVKGLFKTSKAASQWSFPYLSAKYGSQRVIYMETDFPLERISSSYQRPENPTTLAGYIENVTKGNKLILGNDHLLLVDYPELIEDLEIDRWQSFDGERVLPLTLRLFMGGPGTGVGWHAATSHNLFVEVQGDKLFKWFDPRVVGLSDLYPTLSNRLPAIEQCTGHYYSPTLPTWEYVLKSGDAAFTPAWVWHSTHHYEPTVAVGIRMESFLHDVRSAPIQSFLGEFSLDIPGMPFFNGLVRWGLQATGIRLQGQALSREEKSSGYAGDWARDYIQAGGKVLSENDDNGKPSQWKL